MFKRLSSMILFIFMVSGSFNGLPSIFTLNKAFADTKVLPVVELFTAEWCPPCVTANHNVDELLNELGREGFTLIKNHLPGNGGMNNPYGSKRSEKYKIKGIPAVVINGVVSGYDVNQLAHDKNDLKRRILEKNSETTKSTLSIDGKITKNKVDGEVSYTGFPAGSNLHIVFSEQYFYFAGRNGERLHRMISRDAIITMAGSKGSKKYSFIIPSNMPPEMVRIAVFVELQNGEIVHSGDFNPSGIDVSKDGISTMPNELDIKTIIEGVEQTLELNISNFNTATTTVKVEAKDNLLQIIQGSFPLSSVSSSIVKVVFRTRSPLTPGPYNTAVIVSSGAYRKEIPVKFDLLEGPILQISEEPIDFGIVKRGEKSSKTILIQNERKNGALKGSISMDVPWLEISPREIKTDYELITVSALTGKLPFGDYQGKITIATNVRKVDISVSLSVSASLLQAETKTINFGEISEEKLSTTNQALVLSNIGSEDASVSLDKLPEFISVAEKNYQIQAGKELSIELGIDTDKIKINQVNSGTLEISYTDGTLSVPVSISVKEMPPLLQISSAQEIGEELSFELKSGDTASFELQMENIGRGRLDGKISFKNKQAWISSSHAQFALLRGQKRTITFTLQSGELKAGTYKETVAIQSNGGSQEYTITMIVQKNPVIIIELQIGSKNATISGKAVTVDPPPYIKSGTTLVPLRFISEAFGAEIEWFPKQGKGTIVIKLKEHLIQIEIGNTQAMLNGKAMTLIVAPEIVNGRTFVPLRFISEAFGAKVEWIAETQTIRMIYEG